MMAKSNSITGYISRAKHDKHYLVINNDLVQNNYLTFSAKGLLAFLLSHSENWIIRKTWIYKNFPDGRRKITRAFKELEEHGFIKSLEVRDQKGKYLGFNYEVYEVPVKIKKTDVQNEQVDMDENLSIVQNPPTDNPQLENPHAVNEQLINTNLNNYTLKINNKEKKGAPSFNNFWKKVPLRVQIDKEEVFQKIEDIIKNNPTLNESTLLKKWEDYLMENNLRKINTGWAPEIQQPLNWLNKARYNKEFFTDPQNNNSIYSSDIRGLTEEIKGKATEFFLTLKPLFLPSMLENDTENATIEIAKILIVDTSENVLLRIRERIKVYRTFCNNILGDKEYIKPMKASRWLKDREFEKKEFYFVGKGLSYRDSVKALKKPHN